MKFYTQNILRAAEQAAHLGRVREEVEKFAAELPCGQATSDRPFPSQLY